MADQDFNIKVVTTADITGLKQTRAEMEALRQQAEKVRQDAGSTAFFARVDAAAAAKAASVAPVGGVVGGISGTAIGLGTIISLLTVGISKMRAFNAEQDRWVEG